MEVGRVGTADKATWVFRYEGAPERCWIPMDLHADGIVGCVTRIDIENPSANHERSYRIRYDREGRLAFKEGIRDNTYSWDNRRVLSDGFRDYIANQATVRTVIDGDRVILEGTVDEGRLLRLEYRDGDEVTGVAELDWKGRRLMFIDTRSTVLAGDVAHHVMSYACD
jgi:hypothetical protein